MVKSVNTYQPDYPVPPGWVLAEMLESREISHAEFARRCGRSPKLVSEIIAGKAPVEPETALQFERVLDMDASVWLNIEATYKLHQAKKEEERALHQSLEWASQFPLKDLVALGVIEKPADKTDAARKLLAFFRVGTVQAWERRYGALAVAYRHSPSFKSSPSAVAAWLRMGELWAERQESAEYHRGTFAKALREIRGLTTLGPDKFLPRARQLCNEAGVAFVLVPPLSKTPLSGAARWLTPRRALIQQSLRHKSNDHFWFTFFHEAAHILLHSKREVFVDEETDAGNDQEREANAWAANFLIPTSVLQKFAARGFPSKGVIIDFAADLGLAPGIVVGRLQYESVIDWKHHNDLKIRYEWTSPTHGD